MAKSKRTRRARNKIEGASQGALIKAEPSSQPAIVIRSNAVRVAKTSMFSAELEEIIELIAKDRVYRAMLAGLGRRLLSAPITNSTHNK